MRNCQPRLFWSDYFGTIILRNNRTPKFLLCFEMMLPAKPNNIRGMRLLVAKIMMRCNDLAATNQTWQFSNLAALQMKVNQMAGKILYATTRCAVIPIWISSPPFSRCFVFTFLTPSMSFRMWPLMALAAHFRERRNTLVLLASIFWMLSAVRLFAVGAITVVCRARVNAATCTQEGFHAPPFTQPERLTWVRWRPR